MFSKILIWCQASAYWTIKWQKGKKFIVNDFCNKKQAASDSSPPLEKVLTLSIQSAIWSWYKTVSFKMCLSILNELEPGIFSFNTNIDIRKTRDLDLITRWT